MIKNTKQLEILLGNKKNINISFQNKLNTKMKVSLETNSFEELERIISLFKSMQLEKIEVNYSNTTPTNSIQKGDKTQDPRALFGIWKEKPRSIEEIRNQNWKRNWEI